ncbi:MAG: hypothetical protein RDU14_06955 [Melioribacteraceae bacterium]|nr:hypothetical protein [Melioribacteraceae bacterium]
MSSNIRNECKKSFREVMQFAEVFIIDCPTTTLLEALTTTKPLFVLTQFIELNEEAENLLKKRAVCASNVSALVEGLNHFNRSGVYKADVFNDKYLKAFGTHLNDGLSAERDVTEVLNKMSS